MQLHRNNTTFKKLDPAIQSKRIDTAKGTISVNLVVPPGLEKKANKFIKRVLEEFEEDFKDFINDENRKGRIRNGQD